MLKAKFIKYHFNNELVEDKCIWQVWDDDKLLMTYSVKDIRMGNPICNFKLIATKEFGLAILDRCKKLKAFL
jgi:hypothetical protein